MGTSNKVEVEQEHKENAPPSTSKADMEMGENSEDVNKCDVRVGREIVENTIVVPHKKQKLDSSVFEGLEEWEAK